jgi:hypothetical protein
MKYLCLVYYRESDIEAMGQRQWDALNGECIACGEGLRESGHMLDGSALEPTATATTVRVRDGKLSITDGPFAETKEQLAGFYLIEARDLNDAIRVAGKIPPARFGSIEVRPVRELRVENNSGPGMPD